MRLLKRVDARRIAVRAQLLDADRPSDLLSVVDRLTMLQLDPTAAIAPSAELVSWTRLGNDFQPVQLQQALEHDRTLFEHRAQPVDTEPPLAMLRPMADLRLLRARMAAWPHGSRRLGDWMTANDEFRRRILDQLAASGPLTSREIPDSCAVPWESSGWTHDRNVTQMLEFLASRGEVAVAGRRGRERLWDLAARIYPADVVALPEEEARAIRDARWLRSLGVARPKVVGDAGIPVEIEGTVGEWRVDPEATAARFKGRTALLSPFDRLVHDRVRALELFDFDYTLEMYKPAAKRRWGYFALPVLYADQLVGKVDATVDRRHSCLEVTAIHEDVPFTKTMTSAVSGQLRSLATWLGLERLGASP
jgi:uncharacterized protein YcaQ